MEDVIIDFLFGFNESKIARKFKYLEENKEKDKKNGKKKEKFNLEELFIDKTAEFDYANHKASEISLRIFNNMTQKKEHANVVTFKLFEILFEKRPYLMIKKFVKPYTDFVIKKSKDKSKYTSSHKSYPITLQLIELLNFYQKYDTTDMVNNAECSMFKNFAYYINYDIDFYMYYSKNEDELMNNQIQTQNSKTNSISENSLSVDTLMAGVRNFKKNKNDMRDFDQSLLAQLEKQNEVITINDNLLNDSEAIYEGIQNMNFLFMKNLIEKLMNFFNNDNLENIFLTNLLITIISVPCLNFDLDLVQSTAVILDEDQNSKYSFLTIFRYLCQQILIKLKGDEKRKEQLKKFIKIIFKNNNIINKNTKKKRNESDDEDEEREDNQKDKKDADDDFLIIILQKDNKDKIETTNFIIFCEFIKEYICSISHKHKFEGLIENLYGLYCEELHESEHYTRCRQVRWTCEDAPGR